MTWGEAWRAFGIIAADPASATAASMEGWPYPMSREAVILADVYDLVHAVASKGKAKRYPRPWPDLDKTVLGKTTLPVAKVLALLKRRGPAAE